MSDKPYSNPRDQLRESYLCPAKPAHHMLASIPGHTEDGPGIDCLRMRHIIPRNWGLRITSYLCSVKQ